MCGDRMEMTTVTTGDYPAHLSVPKPKCYARIGSGPVATRVAFYRRPNLWRRFWYWALLGWEFEDA